MYLIPIIVSNHILSGSGRGGWGLRRCRRRGRNLGPVDRLGVGWRRSVGLLHAGLLHEHLPAGLEPLLQRGGSRALHSSSKHRGAHLAQNSIIYFGKNRIFEKKPLDARCRVLDQKGSRLEISGMSFS